MIKVIPGKVIEQSRPKPDIHIMKAELLDITTGEVVHYFEFVSTWKSYKKDIKLPNEKRQLKTQGSIRILGTNKRYKSITIRTINGKQEKSEDVLRQLLAKDGRYELANVIEASAAQKRLFNTKETQNGS